MKKWKRRKGICQHEHSFKPVDKGSIVGCICRSKRSGGSCHVAACRFHRLRYEHDPGIKWVKSRQRASNKPKSVKGTGQPRIKKSGKLKQKSSGRKTHYDEDGTLENQLMLVPEFNKAVHSVPQLAVNISVTRYSDKT